MAKRAKKEAKRIRKKGKNLDYEQEALNAIARSWKLKNRACQALALADAQAFATLHLAEMTREGNARRRAA